MSHGHKSGSSAKHTKTHRGGNGVKRKSQLATLLALGLVAIALVTGLGFLILFLMN